MSVIVGAKTVEQLDDNIAATSIRLSASDLATLEQASALRSEYPQWMLDRQQAGRVPEAAA
jgi:aryl-alcohol dehydrogenase-like predicted oxidoreductase